MVRHMRRIGNLMVGLNGEIIGVFVTYEGREIYVPMSQVNRYPPIVRMRVKREVNRHRVLQLLRIIHGSSE